MKIHCAIQCPLDLHEGRSCVGMFSCVKVLCVTTNIKKSQRKPLNKVLDFVASCNSNMRGEVTYGMNPSLLVSSIGQVVVPGLLR